uniref:MBD domain-containing protein n=1 Tax=Strigamia maritima TaxID=126957 RepID=T1III9_STRMM
MKLELGEGGATITGKGTVRITVTVNKVKNEIVLNDVYYVQGFRRNLISLGKVANAKCHIHFHDVNQDFQNEGPFHKPDRRDSFVLHEDSDDSSDEDSFSQQPLVPVIPSVRLPVSKPPLPTASTAPPMQYVTTRTRCNTDPSSTTVSRPNRIAFRDKVPNRPGWEREEVQRQSGTTAGQWDVYFYGPGRVRRLRSRPEVEDYCKTLKVKYDPRDFKWGPTGQSVATFDLDRTEISTVDKDDELCSKLQ